MTQQLNLIKEHDPWYSSGLRFKCTGCGQCCTGSPGYTWVTEQEILAIAQFLNLSIDAFSRKYIRKIDNRYSLKEDIRNYDCVFLKDKKCQIYPVRPKQCRTFPWWLKNLQSELDWNQASKRCEGINHPEAPIVPYKTICEQLVEEV